MLWIEDVAASFSACRRQHWWELDFIDMIPGCAIHFCEFGTSCRGIEPWEHDLFSACHRLYVRLLQYVGSFFEVRRPPLTGCGFTRQGHNFVCDGISQTLITLTLRLCSGCGCVNYYSLLATDNCSGSCGYHDCAFHGPDYAEDIDMFSDARVDGAAYGEDVAWVRDILLGSNDCYWWSDRGRRTAERWFCDGQRYNYGDFDKKNSMPAISQMGHAGADPRGHFCYSDCGRHFADRGCTQDEAKMTLAATSYTPCSSRDVLQDDLRRDARSWQGPSLLCKHRDFDRKNSMPAIPSSHSVWGSTLARYTSTVRCWQFVGQQCVERKCGERNSEYLISPVVLEWLKPQASFVEPNLRLWSIHREGDVQSHFPGTCIHQDLEFGGLRDDGFQILLLPHGGKQVHRQAIVLKDTIGCTSSCNIPQLASEHVHGGKGLLDLLYAWISTVQGATQSFCLSFFAMTCGALIRLLCYSIGLKGGQRNYDPVLRAARGITRGVSFAFLITAWMIPVSKAAHQGSEGNFLRPVSQDLAHAGLEAQLAMHGDRRHEGLEHNFVRPDVPQLQQIPPEPGGQEDDEFVDDFQVAIRILLYQQLDHYTTMWVGRQTTARDICDHVLWSSIQNSTGLQVVEAKPQLADDVVTVCVTPRWWQNTQRVGVVFDHLALGGRPFLGVVPECCTLSDVHIAYGRMVPTEMRFYLQNETTPLPRTGTFRVVQGAVLKLRREDLQRIALPELEAALADPYWIRDLEAHGVPTAEEHPEQTLFIAPANAMVVEVGEVPTGPQLHEMACEVFELDVQLNVLLLCTSDLGGATHCGDAYARVAAILPKCWLRRTHGCTGVFIDARDIGQEITFHLFDSNMVTVEELMTMLDVRVPDGRIIRIAGTDEPEDAEGKHKISQGALLTMWTVDANDSEEDDSVNDSSESEEEGLRHRWKRPFYAMATVYQFQYRTERLRISIIPEDDSDSVLEELQFSFLEASMWYILFQVKPQPNTEYIAVVTEGAWEKAAGRCAVLIDAMPVGGKCFQAFCNEEFRRQDIIAIMGADWRPTFQILAGGDRPVDDECLHTASSGMLITVCRAGEDGPVYRSLEDRLRAPQDWVPEDPAHQYQDDPLHLHTAALVGDTVGVPIVELPSLERWVDIQGFVAEVMEWEPENWRLTTTARHIPGLSIRGHRLPNVMGATQVENDMPYGIFIDARALGAPIAFIRRTSCTANIYVLLAQAGATYHPGLQLTVEGAQLYMPQTGTVTYGHRTVITVKVDTDGSDLTLFRNRTAVGSNSDADAADDEAGAEPGVGGHGVGGCGAPSSDSNDCGEDVGDVSPSREAESGRHRDEQCRAITADGEAYIHRVMEALCGGCTGKGVRLPLVDSDSSRETCFGSERETPTTQPSQPNQVCRSPQGKIVSLKDAIPAYAINVDVQCLRFVAADEAMAIASLTSPWIGFRLATELLWQDVHEHTKAALTLCSPEVFCETPRVIHLYTDGSAKDGRTGWAAVLLQCSSWTSQVSLLGFFGGTVITDEADGNFMGAQKADARDAELTAIGWAILWILAHWDSLCLGKAVIHFDCTSAGFAANGDWSCGENVLAQKVRHLTQILESKFGGSVLEWRHVHGHVGHPWNELADTAATWFRNGEYDKPHVPVYQGQVGIGRLETARLHLCVGGPDQNAFPRMIDGMANWDDGTQVLTEIPPEKLVSFTSNVAVTTWQLRFDCVSANLQSSVGKIPFIEQQLEERGVSVALFQETKGREGVIRSERFIRVSSDSQQHWGTAVWISRITPIGWAEGLPVFVDENSINVIDHGARHLVVTCRARGERFCFISAHYPQQARPREERDQLQRALDAVWSRVDGCRVLMGADVNGRLPSWIGNFTGGRQYGAPDPLGFFFAEVWSGRRLWAPSTFDECHAGEDFTYTHPRGTRTRIDFLIVSDHFLPSDIQSVVDGTLDLLNSNEDHRAVRLTVRHWIARPEGGDLRCAKKRFDVRRLKIPEVRMEVERRLDAIPLPDWDIDVNRHADAVQTNFHNVLEAVVPWKSAAPKSRYISDEAWKLRCGKHSLKGRTANRRRDFRQDMLGIGWDAWKEVDLPGNACGRFLLCKATLLYEIAAAAIAVTTQKMKDIIKRDKVSQLRGICDGVGLCPPQDIMKQVKCLQLGRRRQKKWMSHMPGLTMADGQPTRDRGDLDDLWMNFFCQMEAGDIMDMTTFVANAAGPREVPDVSLDLQAIPTLFEVERTLREVKVGKSAGLDSIPGELLRGAPKAVARHLFPVMLKSSILVRQPIQWRGGVLHAAYKGAGPTNIAANFRSLFVSSTAGKSYHRLMRGKMTPAAQRQLGPCHFGVKAGSPVSHGSHLVLCHEQYCRDAKKSSAVLFLDTRAAYYRVVREAAMGLSDPGDLDACVMKVLRHFGMPESAWSEIIDMAKSGGAMCEAGISQHLRAIARDLHDDAFFVTQYFSKARVCRTKAGSRPGESLADLVFSFVYDQVLRRIRKAVQEQHLTDPIPFDGECSLWEGTHVEAILLTDATWADDSAFMTQAGTPDSLMQRAQRLTAFVYDFAKDLALDPNLKAGKTELMISLRGKGSRDAARKWFGPRGAVLEVQTRASGKISVRVVADYVHLGFHIDRGVTFRPEADRRLSQARSACREFNTVLLQNPKIPRAVRASLFAVLVDSTFFNLELWHGDEGKAWKKLVDGHARLQRGLLRCEIGGEQLVKLTPADVSYMLGVPSMMAMLRSKRLRYLVTLVKAAPTELWAVLKAQKTWMSKVIEDLTWLSHHVPGEWPPVQSQTWPLWWHIIRERTGWFKGQIGKAVKDATVRDLRSDFEREALQAMQQVTSACSRVVSAQQAAEAGSSCYCGPCRKHFSHKTHFACHLRHVHGRRADHLYYCGSTTCPGCRRDFHSWARILKHLKITPECLSVAKAAGKLGEQATHGEGSKVWKADVAKNPAIVPASLSCQRFLLYDDADDDPVCVLPREKLEEQCSSAVGGAVEDWVQAHWEDDTTLEQTKHLFWQAVRQQLVQFPLLLVELQRAVAKARSDIISLQSQAFVWPGTLHGWISSMMCWIGETLTYASLADDGDPAGENGIAVLPGCLGDALIHHEPFMFTRGHVIAMLGDELPDFERTRLLPMLQEHGLRMQCCGWDWQSFRDIDDNSIDGICICISRAWEVRDAVDVNFGWGSFALENWSDRPEFWQARIVRFACSFAKRAWKLLLHGRQVCFALHGEARHLQSCAPLVHLQSHSSWAAWSVKDWVVRSTACESRAGCILSSWGFTGM